MEPDNEPNEESMDEHVARLKYLQQRDMFRNVSNAMRKEKEEKDASR